MSFAARSRAFGRSWLAVSAAAAIALLTGCSSGADEADEAAAAGSEGFPITVEHAMGETTVESEPMTIVALDSSYVDAAVALELDVVGRITYAAGDEALPAYLGEEGRTYAGDATIVGDLEAPDLAEVAELEPDLIVSAKVRHEDVYDQLSRIAPTVFSETTGATWKDNIELLARATGKEDLAAEKLDAYHERAAALGEAITEESGGEAPTMTLARFVGGPKVRLYSSNSFTGIVQSDVGLPRPEGAPDAADDISVDLSQEEILDLDADHIFVSVWNDGTGESQKGADEFATNPLWDQLEGEQHQVDDTEWLTSVSLQGANAILDDMEEAFGVQAQ
ncbi:iron complex transport system substrate-binding protein [Spinactinospora alkalitolerans]|uniref:Iron complex transport system substrate-binding protein n=1 Tax=Spinactinospora alkalitolerans TaxID=687207 RepID=A0A852TYX8_9ACTN|nr:iron-siderophore ABC transporter substrate-binding protein [Spinactinospora alkalitolerans]NYE49011.1 iron complex transport system substrate-binding protein [Spinactinospora alkalitolerans]